MNTFETIMIYAFAFLLVAPHLGMVLAVIWTIVSPPLAKSKKNTNTTAGQNQNCSSTDLAQNHRRLLRSNQHIHNAHEQSHRMAQDAHDTAVRDAWAMHDNADYMAQCAHNTAVEDHNYAVDLNDHMMNDPGFGCGTFF